jgi:hypothetical protein
MIEPPDWLTLANLGKVLESNFTTSLLGALAGAGGGAWAAQKIADRVKEKERLNQQIRDTNISIDRTASAFNTLVNFMEQHARRLKLQHDKQVQEIAAIMEGKRTGAIRQDAPIHVQADMATVEIVYVRLEPLEEALRGVSISGRANAMLAMLGQTLRAINVNIQSRNDQIGWLKAADMNPFERASIIYGLPNDGNIDTTYGDTIDAIYSYAHNCSYFTWQLCLELEQHGRRLRERHKRHFRGEPPKITRVSFEEAKRRGCMPSAEDHKSWEDCFVTYVPPTFGRRTAKARYTLKRAWRRFWRLPWSRKVHVRRP